MTIEEYLAHRWPDMAADVRWAKAGTALNMKSISLRQYNSQDKFAMKWVAQKIINWSEGMISHETFKAKKPYAIVGNVVRVPNPVKYISAPTGELPKQENLSLLMKQTLGDRLTEKRTNGGVEYLLNGKPKKTSELYQYVQDIFVRDGSDTVINYPGVKR